MWCDLILLEEKKAQGKQGKFISEPKKKPTLQDSLEFFADVSTNRFTFVYSVHFAYLYENKDILDIYILQHNYEKA